MERPEEWHRFIDQLMSGAYGPVGTFGQQLWAGLAAIMVVWYGTQMALSGRGVDLAGFVEFVFSLVLPWAMLQFYGAAIPGLGFTTPQVLTGMGGWLQETLSDDAGTAFWNAITEFLMKMWGGLTGQAPGVDDPNIFERIGGFLGSIVKLVTAAPLVVLMIVLMIVAAALAGAQVIWGYFGLALALLLGPIFIPWLMVPQLSWLFWGWFKTVLQYSFYGAVAAGIYRVIAEVGVTMLGRIGDAPVFTSALGLGDLIDDIGMVLGFVVASFLASMKVGEFVQLLMSGAGSLGSNVGTRAMQVARLGG